MQAKKALAVLLALSMTTAPQAVVSASAENATVQENSDVAPEKENSEDAGEESACGQQDVGREEVERIEDAEPEDPPAVQQAQRQRLFGAGASAPASCRRDRNNSLL